MYRRGKYGAWVTPSLSGRTLGAGLNGGAGGPAGVAVRSVSTQTLASGQSPTLPQRSAGDLILAFAAIQCPSTALPSAGSGWTRVADFTSGGQFAMALYYKTSDGTDSVAPYVTAGVAGCHTYAVSGGSGVYGGAATGSGTGTTATAPTVTVGTAPAILFTRIGLLGPGITAVAGQTSENEAGSGSYYERVGYESVAVTGATGTRTTTVVNQGLWAGTNVWVY